MIKASTKFVDLHEVIGLSFNETTEPWGKRVQRSGVDCLWLGVCVKEDGTNNDIQKTKQYVNIVSMVISMSEFIIFISRQ